jgi:ornithine decarboxylase
MSPARIHALQKTWSTNLSAVKPYYAVKCNPDPKLIDILRGYSFGFDCASPRELSLMKPNDDLVYANPCKSDRDLHYASTSHGSPLTVVDSAEEIDKLQDFGYSGDALVRIKVDDTGSKMPFSSKFGLAPEAVGSIATYALQKGIHLRGISFHVGSGSGSKDAHARGIDQAFTACQMLLARGHYADIIDIGGGFVPDRALFDSISGHIRLKIYEKKSAGVRFIAEPGRFFATESQDLFVQVIGKKPALHGAGWRYTIDESLYGQFTNILFDHQTPRWVRVSEGSAVQRKRGAGVLFGRTCDSLDVIARSDDMEELFVGDWLWFPNMGAYTTVTASEFNGFPKPPVFLDEQGLLPHMDNISMTQSVGEIQYIEAVSSARMS